MFDDLTLQERLSRQPVQHNKTISDQASAYMHTEGTQRMEVSEENVAGGLVCKTFRSACSQVDRSGKVKAVATQRSEFVQ